MLAVPFSDAIDNANKEGTVVVYKSAPVVLPGHYSSKSRGTVKDNDPRFNNLFRDPHYTQLPPRQKSAAFQDFKRILEKNLQYTKHYSVHDLAFLPPEYVVSVPTNANNPQ